MIIYIHNIIHVYICGHTFHYVFVAMFCVFSLVVNKSLYQATINSL